MDEIIGQLTPRLAELFRKSEQLAATQNELSNRRRDRADLRNQIVAFDRHYLGQVRVAYAELDSWDDSHKVTFSTNALKAAKASPENVIAAELVGINRQIVQANEQIAEVNQELALIHEVAHRYEGAETSGPQNAAAQFYLGLMYYHGTSIPMDLAQAEVLFRSAAEQGEARAQHFLGSMFYDGFGLPQDFARAAFYYYQAAMNDFVPAQYRLSEMYNEGRGVPRNDHEAVFWRQKADTAQFDETD